MQYVCILRHCGGGFWWLQGDKLDVLSAAVEHGTVGRGRQRRIATYSIATLAVETLRAGDFCF